MTEFLWAWFTDWLRERKCAHQWRNRLICDGVYENKCFKCGAHDYVDDWHETQA